MVTPPLKCSVSPVLVTMETVGEPNCLTTCARGVPIGGRPATKALCRGTKICPGKKPGKTVRPGTMLCLGATIWPGKKSCPGTMNWGTAKQPSTRRPKPGATTNQQGFTTKGIRAAGKPNEDNATAN